MNSRRVAQRRILAAMLGVGLVGVTTACTGSGSGPADPAPEDDVSLRVIVYTSNPDQLALLQELADEFTASDPNVEGVTFESIAVDDLDTKLTAELPSSDPPDVSWMTVVNSARYIEAGALIDLAPILDETDGYDAADLIPSLQTEWQRDDSLYGVPFSTSSQVLYYNADTFRAAGVPTPDERIAEGTWDWEHLAQDAKAISDSQGVPGYSVNYDTFELFYPLMYAYGATPWSEDGATCTMDTPEMAGAASLLHRMQYTDRSASRPGQVHSFFEGQGGFTIAYLSSIPLLEEVSFEWGVVPTPAGPAGEVATVGQSAFVAFEASKNPEAASDLVAHLTSRESLERLAQYWVASRESLLTPETLHESQPLLSVQEFEPIVEGTIDHGRMVPVTSSGGAAQSVLAAAMNEHLFQPRADVGTALEAICGDLQPSLEER